MKEGVNDELELIRSKNHRGLLVPEEVVEFARDEKTALHSLFQWDDSEAARQYRIAQARGIIRVAVKVHEETKQPVQVYVSLPRDRTDGGGYRTLVEVLGDDELRDELLATAKSELATFSKKYETLRKVAEMSPVFEAIDDVTKEVAA